MVRIVTVNYCKETSSIHAVVLNALSECSKTLERYGIVCGLLCRMILNGVVSRVFMVLFCVVWYCFVMYGIKNFVLYGIILCCMAIFCVVWQYFVLYGTILCNYYCNIFITELLYFLILYGMSKNNVI